MEDQTRRAFLYASAAVSANVLVAGCRGGAAISAEPPPGLASAATGNDTKRSADRGSEKPEGEADVTATEDLMREHGVLRRALIVYAESASRLRVSPKLVSPAALQRTAKLFRSFGEDYHEKKLEEAVIFPSVKKMASAASALPDVLAAQHERGRQITEYILAMTAVPKLSAKAVELASVLEAFVRMYEAHTAHEDTVLFPAWKMGLSAKELEEWGEKFEDIEHQQFGRDGFDDAVRQIAGIEAELGLGDLAKFTAPPPPVA